MEERIYTIPVNMAFEKEDGCPFCRLARELEEAELDRILGAAMMEPDVRVETNKHGFCAGHFQKMFDGKNRLGLGLILESHLETVSSRLSKRGGLFGREQGANTVEYIGKLTDRCYICSRVEKQFTKMLETAAILWEREKRFRDITEKQPYFCLIHYGMFLEIASKYISKKRYSDFQNALGGIQARYLDSLREDVSWFCKKFDYRYEKEPWGNAKDAVERAIWFLTGETGDKRRG